MVDVFTKEKRSWVMSRIRGKNTKIEIDMKKILTEIGCKHVMYPKMYGTPDFAIPSKKITIFCDGDFWHGHNYNGKKKPAKQFWRKKIEGNMARDRRVSRKLRSDGWSVLRFWEQDIENNPDKCKRKIMKKLDGSHRS